MMGDLPYLYENDEYFVDVELDTDSPVERDGAVYFDYYVVVCKLSGIVEFKTPSLVEAISGAAMSAASLSGKPWKFYTAKSEEVTEDEPTLN